MPCPASECGNVTNFSVFLATLASLVCPGMNIAKNTKEMVTLSFETDVDYIVIIGEILAAVSLCED